MKELQFLIYNTPQEADKKAETEYDEFNKTQKILSDFDKEIKKMIEKRNDYDRLYSRKNQNKS